MTNAAPGGIRPTSTRAGGSWLLSPLVLGACLIVASVVATSAAASAGLSFSDLDPTTTVENVASGWVSQAAGWARSIYLSLLIFEVIALAITALLFRDNLGEFLAGISFKVFVGGVYFWFINNAGTDTNSWPQQIIKMFRVFGLRLAGMPDDTPNGISPFVGIGVDAIAAAGAYIAAGVVAQAQCAILATSSGFLSFGAALGFIDFGHNFEMLTEGMGLMLLMGTAAIYLQIVMITVESYLVMAAGIVFIGFAGSRFTMPFSQGYFSYMFNVGVKYMVVYIVLAIEAPIMHVILNTAVAALAVAFIPGVGAFAPLIPAAFGLINVIVAAALVWMIPGLVASFLNGQSSASGSAVLGQALGSISAVSNFVAQMHKAKVQESDAKADQENSDMLKAGALLGGGATGQPTGGSSTMSTGSGGGGDMGGGQGTLGPTGAPMGSGNSGGGGGARDADQLARDAKRERADAELSRAFALSSLAQGAPRDIGQPSAVQVRLANPDKL